MRLPITILSIALAAGSSFAQEASETSAVEAKLRESLRATMQQLRAAQTEKAQALADLEALKTTSEREKKEADARFAELTTRSTNEREEAAKKLAEQEKELGLRAARLEALAASLAKWQASHAEVSKIARTKEDERAGLQGKVHQLTQLVADRERRNLELYQTARDILTRYENFAFGRALAAREPFTGLAKVKLEEQVQDYRDKLADQLVRTDEPAKPATPAALAGAKPVAPPEAVPADSPPPAPKP